MLADTIKPAEANICRKGSQRNEHLSTTSKIAATAKIHFLRQVQSSNTHHYPWHHTAQMRTHSIQTIVFKALVLLNNQIRWITLKTRKHVCEEKLHMCSKLPRPALFQVPEPADEMNRISVLYPLKDPPSPTGTTRAPVNSSVSSG